MDNVILLEVTGSHVRQLKGKERITTWLWTSSVQSWEKNYLRKKKLRWLNTYDPSSSETEARLPRIAWATLYVSITKQAKEKPKNCNNNDSNKNFHSERLAKSCLRTISMPGSGGACLWSRPAWSPEWVSEQPGIHREALSQKNKTNQAKTC